MPWPKWLPPARVYQIRRTGKPVLLPTNCLGVSRPHERVSRLASFFPTLVAGFSAVLVMTEKLPLCFSALVVVYTAYRAL